MTNLLTDQLTRSISDTSIRNQSLSIEDCNLKLLNISNDLTIMGMLSLQSQLSILSGAYSRSRTTYTETDTSQIS